MVRCLIVLISIHSCTLGLLVLFAPRLMLRLIGFDQAGPIFFVSQSGIFLLILGLCYFLALWESVFVKVILLSKSLAVMFLASWVALFSPPPLIKLAGLGDAFMLIAVSLAVRRIKEQSS